MAQSSASRARRRWRSGRHRRDRAALALNRKRRKGLRLKVAIPVSPRRDAVPDDARVARCSPNPTIVFEHAIQIGTRESLWTRHDVGGRRADHGRKREPGDGHFRDRDSSQGRTLFQSTELGPEPHDLRDIMNPPGGKRPVEGAQTRERKPDPERPAVENRA